MAEAAVVAPDPLVEHIQRCRANRAGARDELIGYLSEQSRIFIRPLVFQTPGGLQAEEDLHSEVVLKLVEQFPRLMLRLDLARNPRVYFWRVIRHIFWKAAHRFIQGEMRESVELYDPHIIANQLRSRRCNRTPNILAAMEDTLRVKQLLIDSIQSFRMPRYRNAYAKTVHHWIEFHEEKVPETVCGLQTPMVVKYAILYWLVKHRRWVVITD